MATSDNRTIPHAVTEELRAMIAAAGVTENVDLVARILATGIGLGIDGAERLDLKIASAALTEMRAAFEFFAPYEGLPKATIFGSARTLPHDTLYQRASQVAAALAERGWMVVTGAGPGIMQAAAEGAGAEHSLGVSIRLPFEEKPNAVVGENARNVAMKYFFTRKLMLVKESRGFVCVPGGFGTLDELFELLTLQQTGKADPTPIVLLDAPGTPFWGGLRRFVDEQLLPSGVISPGDFERVLITDSVEAAVDELVGFYRNYDSLRWVGSRLVLRLNAPPSSEEVAALNHEFAGLLAAGAIEHRGPLDPEREDDDRLDKARLVMRWNQFQVGQLYRLIDAVNRLPSAPGPPSAEDLTDP